MKTQDIIATLEFYLKQLREIHEFTETLASSTLYDSVIEGKIDGAQGHLCDAATHLSEIIGREILHAEYYGCSSFRFKDSHEQKGGEQ